MPGRVAQSLGKILVHIVFSTKDRRPSIRPEDRDALHGYLSGAAREIGCDSIQIGGTADHVHAPVSLSRVCSVAHVVQEMKIGSSKWMKARGVEAFSWQAGYGAFSIGASQVEALKRYIQRQEEHHRAATFQDELRRVLRRYGVPFDERFVWR